MPEYVEYVRVVCRREDAPIWLHKEFILGYYLHNSKSHLEAAKQTLFGLTNETLNAWTTIIAILVVHALYIYSREFHWNQMPFQIFYVSGVCHLPFSLLCTLFVGVSEQSRNTWRHLDVFFIFTSAVLRGAAIAWSTFSSPAWLVYMAAMVLDWSYCVVSTMLLRSMKDTARPGLVRSIAGICVGYTFPMMVASVREVLSGDIAVSTTLLAGVVLCLGTSAVICSLHIPERWNPGHFDIFGSHAIMHILVTVEYCLEWAFIRHELVNRL